MRPLKSITNLSCFLSSVLILLYIQGFAQDPDHFKFEQEDKELVRSNPDIVIWNVKALLPSGKLFYVKAIDQQGEMYPVKAIQDFEQTQLLDFKAFVDGKRLPIKLLLKTNEKYYPLKAIKSNGTLLDIKAITDKGERLDIKGISQSGNIIQVEVVLDDGDFYNLIAISPKGETNIVKGIKMFKDSVETTVNGVKIFAHVKAIKQ